MVFERRTFAACAADCKDMDASTSGAVGLALSAQVVRAGGIVFAVAWNRDFLAASHGWADRLIELEPFRGSKYVASDMSLAWADIKRFLAEGRRVLFVGTPCQTAAVRKVYGDDQNLVLCALFCYSNVEPAVWRRYAEELEANAHSKITSVCFRDKRHGGWQHGQFTVSFEDGTKNFSQPPTENPYMRAFYCGLSTRSSCLACPFRGVRSGADLLVGDFWGVEEVCPRFADDRGVNAVITLTEKGQRLFDETDLDFESVTYEQILAHNPCLETSKPVNLKARKRFLSAYQRLGVAQAVELAFKPSSVDRIKNKMRRIFGRA